MIISQTPLRISFAGGGSDIPSFYQEHSGAVVSAAINKYIYVALYPRFDGKIRACYSKVELVDHPYQISNEIIREALQFTGVCKGIEIHSMSDVPSYCGGLGSSSSYTVGLLNALNKYQKICQISQMELARLACHLELGLCKSNIGKQDQFIAALGGIQHLRFFPTENQKRDVEAKPIFLSDNILATLQSRLLLLFCPGFRPASKEIIDSYCIQKGQPGINLLCKMSLLANDMASSLASSSLENFGFMLHEGWQLKKELTHLISTPQINEAYEIARSNGALGGKLLGAGRGGFLLFYARPEHHPNIIEALPGLINVPFAFSSSGSQIVLHSE